MQFIGYTVKLFSHMKQASIIPLPLLHGSLSLKRTVANYSHTKPDRQLIFPRTAVPLHACEEILHNEVQYSTFFFFNADFVKHEAKLYGIFMLYLEENTSEVSKIEKYVAIAAAAFT